MENVSIQKFVRYALNIIIILITLIQLAMSAKKDNEGEPDKAYYSVDMRKW